MEIIRGLAISLAMLLPMASSAVAQALDKKVLSFAAAQRIAVRRLRTGVVQKGRASRAGRVAAP